VAAPFNDINTPLYTEGHLTASLVGGSIIANGYAADALPLTGSPILVGAKVVDAYTYTPTYTTNSIASLAIDQTRGALLVLQGSLSPFADSVSIYGSDGTTWQAASIISASLTKSVNTQVLMIQQLDVAGNIMNGNTLFVTSSFTRPDTTASYSSGDVVANATASATTNVLSNVVRVAGGSGIIKGASLVDGTNQPTSGSYEAWIYNTNRTSEFDNVLFSASYTDVERLVAIIPFNNAYVSCSGSAGTIVYFNNTLNYPFVCSPGTSSLYWNLVIRSSYTPIASTRYTLKLGVAVD